MSEFIAVLIILLIALSIISFIDNLFYRISTFQKDDWIALGVVLGVGALAVIIGSI